MIKPPELWTLSKIAWADTEFQLVEEVTLAPSTNAANTPPQLASGHKQDSQDPHFQHKPL